MSFHALSWAVAAPITQSSRKQLLTICAFHANEANHEFFLDQKTLARETALDRKTVIAGMTWLIENGWVVDTGRRRGDTGQVRVFKITFKDEMVPKTGQLNHPENGNAPGKAVPNTAPLNGAENGTVEQGKGPSFPGQGSHFSSKTSQKRDTELIEPTSNLEERDSPCPVVVPSVPMTAAFEEWWREYPRKEGKGAAEKAYAKAVKGGTSPADLLLAIRRQPWSPDPKFRPMPATWLNGERWRDHPDPAAYAAPGLPNNVMPTEVSDVRDRQSAAFSRNHGGDGSTARAAALDAVFGRSMEAE